MKAKRKIWILLCALLVMTAAFALAHHLTRETVAEGAILVREGEEEVSISLEQMEKVHVTGTLVNGKGEERMIDAQGIALGSLAKGSYEKVTVTADDEYSASVEAGEIENAWLIQSDDGSAQLVVFGDTNSKRAVRHVIRIEFH